jgi:hypothetical protein
MVTTKMKYIYTALGPGAFRQNRITHSIPVRI